MTPLLSVENLTAFYGDFQALFGIRLSVDAGETVAIIGANGAGKSTFLKAIAGLLRAPRGSILFDGRGDRRRRASRTSGAASCWCRKGAGCSPRSPSRRTC